jgi:hypothetical protein
VRAQYSHHIPPKSPHLVCTSVPVHVRVVHIIVGVGGSGGMAGGSGGMAGGSGGMAGMSDPMA